MVEVHPTCGCLQVVVFADETQDIVIDAAHESQFWLVSAMSITHASFSVCRMLLCQMLRGWTGRVLTSVVDDLNTSGQL